jgi:hypothetical protein
VHDERYQRGQGQGDAHTGRGKREASEPKRPAPREAGGEPTLAGEGDQREADQEQRDAPGARDERAGHERHEYQRPADHVLQDQPDVAGEEPLSSRGWPMPMLVRVVHVIEARVCPWSPYARNVRLPLASCRRAQVR